MTFEELKEYVNKSIEEIEEEKRKNPLKQMSEDKKNFYDRCEAEIGGQKIIRKTRCNGKTNKH